jgi:hypothetical protein
LYNITLQSYLLPPNVSLLLSSTLSHSTLSHSIPSHPIPICLTESFLMFYSSPFLSYCILCHYILFYNNRQTPTKHFSSLLFSPHQFSSPLLSSPPPPSILLSYSEQKLQTNILDDADLAGPLFFCLLLGSCLLLAGKVLDLL